MSSEVDQLTDDLNQGLSSEDAELSLQDDTEQLASSISGTLTLSSAATSNSVLSNSRENNLRILEEDFDSMGLDEPFNLRFDVIAANIVREGPSKFVVYSICLFESARERPQNITIERRYSQIERLNQSLRKRFPHVMTHIAFPEKHFIGNFRNQVIASRSRAFEQFLTHVSSIDNLRQSDEFNRFFYGSDLRKACKLMKIEHYKEAIPLLQSVAVLQRKLIGGTSFLFQTTLSAIVACCSEAEENDLGAHYARLALKSINNNCNCPLLPPLLETTIRIYWKSGEEKRELEEELKSLQDRGVTSKIRKLHEISLEHLICQLEEKVANVV
ncbi:DgyrCDS10306 [Dimorphilus gyrociliatus]|uniref:DgyrCDS10306 n=1 Tax=Dimorphilus gyrociliatus TaxID=2664684 RepID=A0A7I8W1T0_9ANNE|nr:DgyrCDS10306 [Dimorphilus gyrociliatus]